MNERISDIVKRTGEMNKRTKDIVEKTCEISRGEDIGKRKDEILQDLAEIADSSSNELMVMVIIPKNKTIKEGLDEPVKNIKQLQNGETEIEAEINQKLADLKTSVQEIRQNIMKAGVRMEEIDFGTRKLRKRIKKLQGDDEDDGDEPRCRVA